MKIVGRFIYEGKNCYDVDTGDYIIPCTERGLYEEMIMTGLIEEGYKFFDYHGNILMPTGIAPSELVESACTHSISELQNMLEAEEIGVLSESEATKYFSRVDVKSIEMKEPSEVRITTREELIQYLKGVKARSHIGGVSDFLPLNSFVAKEALFTIEELLRDPELQVLYRAVSERRVLHSVEDYKTLVRFLQDEGVLGQEFTYDDVIAAYMSWGLCGINTTIVSKTKRNNLAIGITDSYMQDSDAPVEAMNLVGMMEAFAVVDRSGAVHYEGESCDKDDLLEDGGGMRYVSPKAAKKSSIRLSEMDWDAKYLMLHTLARTRQNRWFYEVVESNGGRAVIKVDACGYAITVNGMSPLSGNFLSMQMYDGSIVPLSMACTEELCILYNMTRAKALSLVAANTKKPPKPSSAAMLREDEGCTLRAAVTYLGRLLEEEAPTEIPYWKGYELYERGLNEAVLEAYGIEDGDYRDMDELIDELAQACSNTEDGEGPVLSLAKFPDIVTKYADPVEILTFAKQVKENSITLGMMKDGRRLDSDSYVAQISSVLRTVVLLELDGDSITYNGVQRILDEVDTGMLIDFNSLIKERTAEYEGYYADRARYRAFRAECAMAQILVTKVFREISNEDAEKQRHYAMECLVFPTDAHARYERNLLKLFAEKIEDELKKIVRPVGYMQEGMIKDEAIAMASRLVFDIILKNVGITDAGSSVRISKPYVSPYGVEGMLTLELEKSQVERLLNGYYLNANNIRYITLYDWCANEVDGAARFFYNPVNAIISPWRVTPKEGFTIKSYPFYPNYVGPETMKAICVKKQIPEVWEALNQNKACNCNLADGLLGRALLNYGGSDFNFAAIGNKVPAEEIDTVLDIDAEEYVENYFDRWAENARKFKSNDLVLMRMPLKADIVCMNVAADDVQLTPYGGDFPVEYRTHFYKDSEVITMGAASTGKAIAGGNRVYTLDADKVKYEDAVRWTPYIRNIRTTGVLVSVKNNYLSLYSAAGTSKGYYLPEVSEDVLRALVSKNIAYQLDAKRYAFRADRVYVVEV